MIELTFVLPSGERRTVAAQPGVSVMETALKHDIPGILAECGGSCSCATCHVYVAEDALARVPPPESYEDQLLHGAASERRPNSRLSCQVQVGPELAGAVIEIPPTQI